MQTPKFINQIIAEHPAWLQGQDGVVVSSRVRLARNIKGCAFPDSLAEDERMLLWKQVCDAVESSSCLESQVSVEMDSLSELSRKILFERHLVSREQMQRGSGSGLIARRDESLSLMVNEEDHLRLQSFQPGADIMRAWERLDAVDSAMSEHLEYAFSSQLGYLTCCPSNVGTGMRASVMLHLPAISLLNEMRAVANGLAKIGLAVRGIWGEGSEIAGHMYQVSNQVTLGKDEVEIIKHIGHIVSELSEHEDNAARRLMQEDELVLLDTVFRSRGTLENARLMTSKESMEHLSWLRFGIGVGVLDDLSRAAIDRLFLSIQPAHLQLRAGEMLSDRQRDELRADTIRDVLLNHDKRKGDRDE